ncbi:hypothetical protein C8R44DRAFT_879532 [Mycena epipterygia]|nr:hypothetical protein C8R44DRAFT_879532 [Mycena epipterygia]
MSMAPDSTADLFADLLSKTYTVVRLLHDFPDPSSPHPTVASAVPSPPRASTSAGPSSSTIAHPTASASPSAPVASTSSAQTHAAKRPATSTDAATSDTTLH